MTASPRTRPPAKAWVLALVVTLGVAAILIVADLIAGLGGVVPALLGVVGMVGLAPRTAPPVWKAGLVVVLALSGAAAAAVGPDAVLLPWVVALTALATVPFTVRFGAVALAVPVLPAVIGALGSDLAPWPTGALAAVGALGVAILVRLLGITAPPDPIPRLVAWGHGVILAVLAGGAIAVVLSQGWGHGYWLVIGLCVVLSPAHLKVRAETSARMIGTAVGAVAAIVLALLLPSWVVLIVAAVAMVAGLAYAVVGRRVEMIAFQTVTVISAAGAAAPELTWEIAATRFLLIAAGAVVALLGAEFVVGRLERLVEAREQD